MLSSDFQAGYVVCCCILWKITICLSELHKALEFCEFFGLFWGFVIYFIFIVSGSFRFSHDIM